MQYTDPHSGAADVAKTEQQTAGQNRAGGVSVFVAAAAASALGSWTVWARGQILWDPSLPCSPVPVEEGTA